MQITRIQLSNHPVLGSIDMNFCRDDGTPYNNIVFAGENGCGKTTILDFLNGFTNNIHDINRHKIDYDFRVEFLLSEQEKISLMERDPARFNTDNIQGKVYVAYNSSTKTISTNMLVADALFPILLKTWPTSVFSRYSRVDINFQSSTISAIGASELDRSAYDIKRGTATTLATEIKQVFVDVASQDSDELSAWVDENTDKVPPLEIRHRRMSRFANAFNNMFNGLRFSRIDTRGGVKDVLFQKNGRDISIDNLSSGEKQVVFRGGQLLRDKGSMYGAITIVDEPEISMHPKWQEKIFEYYKSLCTNSDGQQISQLFVATHSEHVIKSAFDDGDLIVILKNVGGVISSESIKRVSNLPFSPTYSEIKYFAFNIPNIEFHDELYGEIQQKFGGGNEKGMEDFLSSKNVPKMKKWARLHRGTFESYYVTQMTFIRNIAHHPEVAYAPTNPLGKLQYTDTELKASINDMLKILNT